jgi:hypothetical protein
VSRPWGMEHSSIGSYYGLPVGMLQPSYWLVVHSPDATRTQRRRDSWMRFLSDPVVAILAVLVAHAAMWTWWQPNILLTFVAMGALVVTQALLASHWAGRTTTDGPQVLRVFGMKQKAGVIDWRGDVALFSAALRALNALDELEPNSAAYRDGWTDVYNMIGAAQPVHVTQVARL